MDTRNEERKRELQLGIAMERNVIIHHYQKVMSKGGRAEYGNNMKMKERKAREESSLVKVRQGTKAAQGLDR